MLLSKKSFWGLFIVYSVSLTIKQKQNFNCTIEGMAENTAVLARLKSN